MKRIITLLLVIAALAAIGAAIYLRMPPERKEIEVSEGRISDLQTMVRLCSTEIYNEVPVLDTINNKVIFAVQKQRGSISFDLENLQADTSGDTVRITLPREIVELREATDRNSWEVIDTKAIGPMAIFHSDKLTVEEENAVKARQKKASKDRLYRNGTIRRARREAAENLRRLAEHLYRKPATVADPTPHGTP